MAKSPGPGAVAPMNPPAPQVRSLDRCISDSGAAAISLVQSRVAIAKKFTAHFSLLTSDPTVTSDAAGPALLTHVQHVIENFASSGFTPPNVSQPVSSAVPSKRRAVPSNSGSGAVANPIPASSEAQSSAQARPRLSYAATAAAAPSSLQVPGHAQSKPKPAVVSAPSDQRIMVRLPVTSHFHHNKAAQNLEVARRALGEWSMSVRALQNVPSGLALVPVDATGRVHILDAAPSLKAAFSATAVEEQVGRDSFIVPFAPSTLAWRAVSPDGSNLDSNLNNSDYAAEVEAALGHKPLSVHMADNGTPTTCTLFLSFARGNVKPSRRLRLYGADLRLVRSKRNAKIQQCTRCFGFHPTRGCSRPALCRLCGSSDHVADGHPTRSDIVLDHVLRCVQCHGPHAADSQNCPARPVNSNGRRVSPSRTELGHIRARGREARRKTIKEYEASKQPAQASASPPSPESHTEREDVDMQDSGDPEPHIAPAAAPTSFARSVHAVVPNTQTNSVRQS